jgi:hypothetical protein
MFAAIARSLFDAYKRQGATVRVVWHPGTFSGERYSIDTVEVIKAEFRDLRQSEIVSVDGVDFGVRDIASDDGVFLRLVIGVPDHGSCA